jgi:hypothetical protein
MRRTSFNVLTEDGFLLLILIFVYDRWISQRRSGGPD